MQYIESKTILSKLKHKDTWFGTTYSMNLYRGCQHNCIYCDTRSECYRIGDLSNIRVKENAHELLAKELRRKKEKGTINFGSMNDPYMPIEKKLQYTREALQIIDQFRFPIHIITKGTLVTRDVDLLESIGKQYAAVSLTITTPHDELSKKLEPGAPPSSERIATVNELSKAGIYCGVTLMPLLPYVNDKLEDVKLLVNKLADAGVKYIIASFGLTLRDQQRDYYYQKLDERFPGASLKYKRKYREAYSCQVENAKDMYREFGLLCESKNIPIRMKFYKTEKPKQMSLF